MNRPLAAENTNDGRMARDTVVESLADDGMMFLAVKKTALDLIEWQTQELERLRGELAGAGAVYVVTSVYREGGPGSQSVEGLFTKEAHAEAYKDVLDTTEDGMSAFREYTSIREHPLDEACKCPPVMGVRIVLEEGDTIRPYAAIVGQYKDRSGVYDDGRCYARVTRPTEAEARARVAELMKAEGAKIEARKAKDARP